MALVHRFVRGEHPAHLAALFQLSPSYTYLLLHNGVWLFAVLWGSLYYRHWDQNELGAICTPPRYHESYTPRKAMETVIVAGDCTESEIASYDEMRFAKVVHSEKKDAPTLKIFTVTALNKFTLLHSAVYGGSATERAPAEAVIESPEWMKLFEPAQDLLVTLDRGFAHGPKARTASVALKKGSRWLPAFLNKETQGFTVKQVATNQVRDSSSLQSFFTLLQALFDAVLAQVQNGLRAAVELANAAAKDTAQMARPTVLARNLFDAVAHIAIASANRAVAASCHFLDLILRAAGDGRLIVAALSQTMRFRALYAQAVRPHMRLLPCSPKQKIPPPPLPVSLPAALLEREGSWRRLLEATSENLLLDLTMLRVEPIRQLASEHPQLALASYDLRRPLPDDRSLRYYLAHRLCMLEFGELADGFLLKAHVGGSMRQVTHIAVLLVRDCSVVDCCCSCANGLACTLPLL
jgi:hypothetical protein